MSRRKRKPSKADYAAFNRATPVGVRYPPGSGQWNLRVTRAKPGLRRPKQNNDEGE